VDSLLKTVSQGRFNLPWAGLILICVLTGNVWAAQSPNNKGYKENGGPGPKPFLCATFISNDGPDEYAGEADNDAPCLHAALKNPEVWLVIVGGITCLFIMWQAWETRKAAEAAGKNTEAYISGERGWIVAELIPEARPRSDNRNLLYRTVNGKQETLTVEDITAGKHLEHRLTFNNLGRTAAIIARFRLAALRSN